MQRTGQWNGAKTRLKTRETAKRSRDAHRAPGIGAKSGQTNPNRGCSACTTRRTTGLMCMIKGIQDIARPWVFARRTERNFMHVGFGKNQGTCFTQTIHRRGLIHTKLG